MQAPDPQLDLSVLFGRMAELLQSRESTAENRQASTSLNQLLHGNSRRGFQVSCKLQL